RLSTLTCSALASLQQPGSSSGRKWWSFAGPVKTTEEHHELSNNANRYSQIIERIFFNHYEEGAKEVRFERTEIEPVAAELNIKLPKNLGDVVYSFRYRTTLPESVRKKAAEGETWIIRPAGRGQYRF